MFRLEASIATVLILVTFACFGASECPAQPTILFDAPVVLDSDPGCHGGAKLDLDVQGNVVAVWQANGDLVFARSSNRGRSWTSPQALLPEETTDDGYNDFDWDIATDGNGSWVVVWASQHLAVDQINLETDVFATHSTDGGSTWSPRLLLSTNDTMGLGSSDEPALATDHLGHWVVVWSSAETLNGTVGNDTDIFVSRSADSGKTWSAPAALNSNASFDSGHDRDPFVATDENGTWLVVWETGDSQGGVIGTDRDILASRSFDDGQSWSQRAVVNTNAAIDSGADFSPAVAGDGGGHWVIVWGSNDSLNGTVGTDIDILTAASSDNGASWSPPAPLNSSASSDRETQGLPLVETDRAGNWVAIWMDWIGLGAIPVDLNVASAGSNDNGTSWTDQALLAVEPGYDLVRSLRTDRMGHWIAAWTHENASGTCSESLVAQGSFCGNGSIDLAEQCDDGNRVAGDCCSASCLIEPDGTSCGTDACSSGGSCESGVCQGGSSCDDGNACNGIEFCDPGVGCMSGNPLECDLCQGCDPVLGCVNPACTPIRSPTRTSTQTPTATTTRTATLVTTNTATVTATLTSVSTRTGTRPPTLTPVRTRTGTRTPNLTRTPTPTVVASRTPTQAKSCIGDCNHDSGVEISELIRGVSIALGSLDLENCPPFDEDGNRKVHVAEIVMAVNNALHGCPPTATATPTPSPTQIPTCAAESQTVYTELVERVTSGSGHTEFPPLEVTICNPIENGPVEIGLVLLVRNDSSNVVDPVNMNVEVIPGGLVRSVGTSRPVPVGNVVHNLSFNFRFEPRNGLRRGIQTFRVSTDTFVRPPPLMTYLEHSTFVVRVGTESP